MVDSMDLLYSQGFPVAIPVRESGSGGSLASSQSLRWRYWVRRMVTCRRRARRHCRALTNQALARCASQCGKLHRSTSATRSCQAATTLC
eukprot:gene12611-biopygen9110